MNELTLGLRIKVNDDGSVQVLNQTGAGIDRVSNSASRANQNLQSLKSTVTTAAASMLAGFSMGKIIDEIGSFESKMINVKALTMANTDDMKAMELQARELGATTAFSAQQAAEAQGVLGSAGLKTNQILSATPVILQLAAAGQLDMARSAEIAIGTMRGMGMELTDLARISDVAAKTAADTFSNVGDIGDAMKNAAPLAKAFNIDLEDMSAAIGVLADNQIKGAEAGNNFKAVLAALGNETKDKTELLKQHGISFAELNIQQRGLVPVMETLRKAHLSGAEAITLFGTDAAAAGLILSENSKKLGEFSAELDHAAGTAKTQADILNQGLVKAFDALGGAIGEAIQQIGDESKGGLKGALTGLVQAATGVISIYEGMGDAFARSNNLTKEEYENLKSVATELEIVAGAAGGIATLTAGIWLANTAMAAFNLTTRLNPLIAISGLAAAGIGAVISQIDTAKKKHEDFMKSATTAEEANLKVKQKISEITQLVPVGTPGYSQKILKEQHDTAMAELTVLVDQRNALEEKAKATNIATDATKNSTATTVAHTAQQTASAEASKKIATAEKNRAEEVQKTIAALQNELAVNRLSDSEKALQSELYNKLLKAKGAERDIITSLVTQIHAEANARKAQTEHDEKLLTSMDALTDKYKQLTLSARAYYEYTLTKGKIENGKLVPSTLTQSDIQPLMQQFDKNAAAESANKKIDDARSALESYNKALDDAHAKTSDLQSVTSAVFDGALGGVNLLAGAFDKLVGSIETTTREHERLNVVRAQLDAFTPDISKGAEQYLKDVKTKSDAEKKYASDVSKLNEQTTLNQLSGARQIAGAMSQMFGENTKARQAFHNVEMTLAAIEMAMSVKKIALEIGGYLESTAAHTASVAPFVAGEAVKGEAAAATAVAEQAGAGPYIGFALMAAMAVAMGALGFLGGGKATSPGPQGLAKDTGTVLGDSSAKSESIDKTYQLLKDIQAQNYPVLKSIDSGIHDLKTGITDVVTRMFQAGGLPTVNPPASVPLSGLGKDIAMALNIAGAIINPLNLVLMKLPIIGDIFQGIQNFIIGGIFGGKQTSTVVAQGIATASSKLEDILNKVNVSVAYFSQIETKTSGGWFGKDKFSFSNVFQDADAATSKAMNDVFRNMATTVLGLSKNLGDDLGKEIGSTLHDRVMNYVIPFTMVDLKGLSGEDATKKMNGVLSTMLDTMATSIFGDIVSEYQTLGEGMLETTTRIVTEIAVVKDALGTVGTTLSGNIIKTADDISYFSGGVKEFQKNFDNAFEKFALPINIHNRLGQQLESQLSSVFSQETIKTLSTARSEYSKLFASLDQTNPLYAQQVALMVTLADKADTYYKYIEEETSRRRSLEIDYYSAAGHAADALNAKRADELAALRLTGDAIAVNYQEMIYAAQDAAAQRKLEIALLEAQGNTLEATNRKRQDELAGLTASQKAIQNAIYATQDLAAAQKTAADAASTALDRSLQRLQVAVNAQKSLLDKKYKDDTTALKDQLDATLKANATQKQSASDLVNSLTSIAGKIRSAIGSTVVETAALDRQRRLSAQAVLQSALDLAKSGGSLVNFVGLDQALTDIAKPSEQLFASFEDYARDQGRTAVVISSLADHADSQVSVAQATLNAIGSAAEDAQRNYDEQYKLLTETYQSDTARLDQIVSSAQAQIDALKGIDNSVLSVATALDRFAAAMGVANQTTLNIKNQSLQDQINAGVAPTFKEGWVGNSPFKLIYQSSAGATYSKSNDTINLTTGSAITATDARQFVNDALAAGNPGSVYTAAKENGVSAASLDALMGWDPGTSNAWASANKLPSFDVGINYVPNDMVANIHQGERILPAADNRELMMRLSEPGRNDAELVAEIQALRKTVAELKGELEQIKKNTSDTEHNTRETSNVLGKVTLGRDAIRTTPA